MEVVEKGVDTQCYAHFESFDLKKALDDDPK